MVSHRSWKLEVIHSKAIAMNKEITNYFSRLEMHIARALEKTEINAVRSDIFQIQSMSRWLRHEVASRFQGWRQRLTGDEEYEVFVFAEELRRQGAKLHGRSLWLAAKYIHTRYRADDAWNLPHQDECDLPEDEFVPSLEDNIALYVETYMIEELLP